MKNILIWMFDGLPLYRANINRNNSNINLPNYNKLIEKGVHYSNVIATAPSTAMSLTSMFTGLYVHELGRRSYSNEDSEIPSDTVSLFKDLENQGYNTYVLWDAELETGNPIKYKINAWSGSNTKFKHFRRKSKSKSKSILGKISHKVTAKKGGDWLLGELNYFIDNEFSGPWAAFVRFGPELGERYTKSSNEVTNYIPDNELFQFDSVIGEFFSKSREDLKVIICEDHGKMLGENGILSYAFNLMEGTLYTPILVVDSDLPHCIIDKTISLSNFKNIVLDREVQYTKYIYADSSYADQWHRKTMVRKGKWKYIYNRDEWPVKEQLFDLDTDPNEMINLAQTYYVDPYRDNRPEGDTVSKLNSPSGLSIDGEKLCNVIPRSDWKDVLIILDELREERLRVWELQGVKY